MSNLPKKMEKFNNFVSHSFKVTDDSVSTTKKAPRSGPSFSQRWLACELHVIYFISGKEAIMGICAEKQPSEVVC